MSETAWSPEALVERIDSLPLWEVELVKDAPIHLSRSFVAKNFVAAMEALQAMGEVAERLSHHPDFHLTSYRNVCINIYTHSQNNLTEKDFQLAAALDEQVRVLYSPKWLKEHPEAKFTSKE